MSEREVDEADKFPEAAREAMVPVSQAAMIMAHGMNQGTGRQVLYIALNEDAMGVLQGKEPALYAVPGVPGLEGWEVCVIGPEGVGPFMIQIQAVPPEKD